MTRRGLGRPGLGGLRLTPLRAEPATAAASEQPQCHPDRRRARAARAAPATTPARPPPRDHPRDRRALREALLLRQAHHQATPEQAEQAVEAE